jgi:hypothetical protein
LCFPVAGTWWYAGTDPVVDHGRIIRRIADNAATSTKSLLAFGAQHSGRFPPNQQAFSDFAAAYLETILSPAGATALSGISLSGTASPHPAALENTPHHPPEGTSS